MIRLLSLVFILSLSIQACFTDNKNKKYNFVIVFVDDLGYGDLSTYGHPTIKTPNLDRMAYEGQKWTQFYSAASVCTPSRAGLLTGRLPIRNGMMGKNHGVFFPDSQNGIPTNEVTIPEELKKQGYKTAIIGKWHLGHKKEYLPLNHGFDYFFGIPYSNDMNRIEPHENVNSNIRYSNYWKQYKLKKINSDNYNIPLIENYDIVERPVDQTKITSRFTNKAIEFIRNNKNKDFFLYLAHPLPHIPLYAGDNFLGKSKRGIYGDVVEEIDHGVGLIIDEIKQNKLEDKTIIIFTSDNGPWLPYETHGGSAGILREGKGTTWEGGFRVPGIFWGGKIRPGIIDDIGSTLDLFPTILSLTGSKLDDEKIIDGFDIKETLFKAEPTQRDVVFYYRNREIFAVRYGKYKAHFITQGAYNYPEPNQKIYLDEPLLFNLENDPSEKYNIYYENQGIINEINLILEEHLKNLAPYKDLLEDRSGVEF
tara:strand:+ start:2939 stop:4375 length:1437 start_codon:yes stop_codon:yes gene_type:complete